MIDLSLPLRAVQFLFAVITLGLTGYVNSYFTDHDWAYDDAPSQVNFLIFSSVWTMLVTPYLALAPRFFPKITHKFVTLGVDAVTCIFWFAGFIALAAYRGDLGLCTGRVCDCLNAGAVFGAFEWVLFTATTVLAALHVWRTRGTGQSKPAPDMATTTAA
ncbi:MAG: hypothetical protein LQ342_007038 [Letrouitia transgressa]|nr:MAG: hypothetical protein LQ342_007038 [Letrouitia transgressa]